MSSDLGAHRRAQGCALDFRLYSQALTFLIILGAPVKRQKDSVSLLLAI
jgi:hypothetical protein